MAVDLHTLRVLEFPRIVDRLAELCNFEPGRERALDLVPVAGPELITRRTRTAEAMRLLELQPGFSVTRTEDPRAPIEEATLGGTLLIESIQLVARFVEAAHHARTSVRRASADVPFLAAIAEDMPQLRDLERDIARSIDARGDIADSASPELAAVRRDIRTVHGRLTQRLNELMASARYRPIVQEPIITVRDDRYVIPIKADFRGSIRGVVHDTSSSGQTLFIEPMAVVEMNNQWRELRIQERREVEKVLRHLSRLIASQARPLRRAVDALAELDFCVARARLAVEQRATLPAIANDEGWQLRLRRARHPLLRGNVVPLDVELGGRFPCVVITGPNTGGKTVALKTIGLLSLMALSGLAIPADPESTIPPYSSVFADIGDEQSIEQSLSTFGSHMRNIVDMLRRCDDHSLVLLDELGAGTDPAEGSALARAILEHLASRRISTIATTHHSEIKAFAHEQPGVRNASMEFDPETLAPTYRLILDVPGRSNAFEIAARLGLDDALVARARAMQPTGGADIDALIQDLHVLRQQAETARNRAERDQRIASDLLNKRQAALDELESTKSRQLEEAEQALNRYRREVETRLRRIASRIDRLDVKDRATVKKLQDQLASVQAAEPPRKARTARVRPAPPPTKPLAIGDTVTLVPYGTTGVIEDLKPDQQEARVLIGDMRAWVPLADLRPASRTERREAAEPRPTLIRTAAADVYVRPELDIRGVRADEVSHLLDRYLDDALLGGLTTVRIIHGKGSGALRQAVRDELVRSPAVRTFELAEQAEGGEGVTVAILDRAR